MTSDIPLPPFWREMPHVWFKHFENVTNEYYDIKCHEQKVNMVILKLEKEDLKKLNDDIFDLPPEQMYEAIKERLISVFEESQLQKLFSEMDLGNEKPSQLLRRMRTITSDKGRDSLLRLTWLNSLPPRVRSVLMASETISKETALEELAKLADELLEQDKFSAAVLPKAHSETDMQRITEEIQKLRLEIAKLKTSLNKCCYSRSRTRSQSRHRCTRNARSRDSTPSNHCYYHQRFGAEAIRCITPCTFRALEN